MQQQGGGTRGSGAGHRLASAAARRSGGKATGRDGEDNKDRGSDDPDEKDDGGRATSTTACPPPLLSSSSSSSPWHGKAVALFSTEVEEANRDGTRRTSAAAEGSRGSMDVQQEDTPSRRESTTSRASRRTSLKNILRGLLPRTFSGREGAGASSASAREAPVNGHPVHVLNPPAAAQIFRNHDEPNRRQPGLAPDLAPMDVDQDDRQAPPPLPPPAPPYPLLVQGQGASVTVFCENRDASTMSLDDETPNAGAMDHD